MACGLGQMRPGVVGGTRSEGAGAWGLMRYIARERREELQRGGDGDGDGPGTDLPD